MGQDRVARRAVRAPGQAVPQDARARLGDALLPASMGRAGHRAGRHRRAGGHREAPDLRQVRPDGVHRARAALRRLRGVRELRGRRAAAREVPHDVRHDGHAAGAAVRAALARGAEPPARAALQDAGHRRGGCGPLRLWARADKRRALCAGGRDALDDGDVRLRRDGGGNALGPAGRDDEGLWRDRRRGVCRLHQEAGARGARGGA